MRIIEIQTDEQIREARQRHYLTLWPVEKQMEAHADNANGNDTKLKKMLADFEAIKKNLPYQGGNK